VRYTRRLQGWSGIWASNSRTDGWTQITIAFASFLMCRRTYYTLRGPAILATIKVIFLPAITVETTVHSRPIKSSMSRKPEKSLCHRSTLFPNSSHPLFIILAILIYRPWKYGSLRFGGLVRWPNAQTPIRTLRHSYSTFRDCYHDNLILFSVMRMLSLRIAMTAYY